MPAPVLSLYSLVECAQVSSGTAARYARRENPGLRAWHCRRNVAVLSQLAVLGRAERCVWHRALPCPPQAQARRMRLVRFVGRLCGPQKYASGKPNSLVAFPCGAGQRGVATVESEISSVVSEIAEQVELMRQEQAHLEATREAGNTALLKALLKRDAQLRTNLKQLRTKEERLRKEALRLRRKGALLKSPVVGLSFFERSATHAQRQLAVRPARWRCRRQPCQRRGPNTSSERDLCCTPASARRYSHQLPSQQLWSTQRSGASRIIWQSHCLHGARLMTWRVSAQ